MRSESPITEQKNWLRRIACAAFSVLSDDPPEMYRKTKRSMNNQ
jgi:hypothetical protein